MKTQKLKFYLEQQIIGPLLFSYEGYLNLDNNSDEYAEFSNSIFGLNFKRRAYPVGAFYKESSQAFGIQFNLNNSNYLGSGSKGSKLLNLYLVIDHKNNYSNLRRLFLFDVLKYYLME